MFARNTPRRPHPFGWIDLLGRRWSVKVTKISAHTLPSSLFVSFAVDLNRIYEATIINALPKSATLLGEELAGENIQLMHLDVTRFASHYIASADVLHS
jgi:chaperone required for assembly of F1-ATPase